MGDIRRLIVAVSGGRDSTAALLWCQKYVEPPREIITVFCDTGAEWPETYEYLEYLEERLSVELVRLQNGTLTEVVRRYGWWPDAKYRVCTEALKRRPLGKFLTETDVRDGHTVVVMGLRAEEGEVRRRRGPLFYERHLNIWVWSPLFEWTKDQVKTFLEHHRIRPNPVYQWAGRVGCGVCVLAKPKEVANFVRQHPERAEHYIRLEEEVGSSWRSRVSLKQVASYAKQEDLLPADEECKGNGCYTCEVL